MDLATLTTRIRRADFLDGLGISVEAERVALAHVSKRLFRVVLHQAASFPLASPDHPEERLQSLADAVGSFVHGAGMQSSAVHLCLPRRELLLNRLVLPAAARENLAQVLEYEVERVIPLPRDEIFYGYQLRQSGGGDAGRLAVLLISVPQRIVRQYMGALEGVGMRPKAISISAGTLGDFAAFCLGDLSAPTALIGGSGDARELALFVDGQLAASHVLEGAGARDDASLQALCRRDLAEVFHSDDKPVRVLRAEASEESEGLFALAAGRLETPAGVSEAAEPSVLPAIGAALGAVREGVVGINLLPEEHRPGLQEGLFVPLMLMAAVVVLALLYGGSVIVRDEMTGRSLASEVEELRPRVDEVRAQENEARKLQEQAAVLIAQEDRRMVQYLRELTEKIPIDAYLTTLRFRNDRIEMDGFASRSSELIQVLETSPMFRSVKFTSPVTTGQGGKERFSIVAEVEE
jgi:Tfp pilus assembly protein PilN